MLSTAERNLAVCKIFVNSNEQELLAIRRAINHFTQFLISHQFRLLTNSTGYVEIFKKPDLCGKSCASMVGGMEFTLNHRAEQRRIELSSLPPNKLNIEEFPCKFEAISRHLGIE